MDKSLAVVHIWEREGKKFRILFGREPFVVILQESIDGMNDWVTIDETVLMDLAHDNLDPLKLHAWDVLQVFKTIMAIMQEQ